MIEWQIFNFLAGNSDGHAKNLSLLYSAGNSLRLAPFYDLVCTRATRHIDAHLALSIGGQHNPGNIGKQHWSGPIAAAHWRYTRHINFRHNWRGHLWQERFYSTPMDEVYLHNAVRYVEQNPVTASLCAEAADWQWSSARAHLSATDDTLVTVAPMLERIRDYGEYIRRPLSAESSSKLELHLRTGRPLGSAPFVDAIEASLGRSVRPRKAGRKSR